MIEVKIFDVVDRDVLAHVLAVPMWSDFTEKEGEILRSAEFNVGWRGRHVLLGSISGDGVGMITADPSKWAGRSMTIAHAHIRDNWDQLESGDVIDIRFILGETFHKIDTIPSLRI